jgi:hypothetical protein
MATDIFRKFVEKWVHPDWPPVPVPPDALDAIEARFETYLPLSYRDFMERIGPAGTGASLLEAIAEQRLDIPGFQEFLAPAEVKETTRHWRRMGLPESMVAFATEGSGDLYCFEVVPEDQPVPVDATVWYFDHEEREVESLEIEFSKWVELYASISKS